MPSPSCSFFPICRLSSNKAKLANLVIEGCVMGSEPLDFESNLFATNIVTSAPVVFRDCRGSSQAGMFFSSFRNNTNLHQSATLLVSDGCTLDIEQVEFVGNEGFATSVVYGEAIVSEVRKPGNRQGILSMLPSTSRCCCWFLALFL